MMKFYRGLEDGTVLVQPEPDTRRADAVALPPRLDLANKSPTGFAWGYGGSGPAQLALALACDVLSDDEKALSLFQDFKFRWVAALPQGRPWGPVSDDEMRRVLSAIEQEAAARKAPG